MKHDAVGRSLATHLRARSKPPLVFEEIALAGSYGSAGRLDVAALYIGPEYAGAWVEGYEVKGSRSDLMRDLDARKWERYRGHGLRRFSFAFPEGVARPSEIPKEAGVIVLRSLGAEGRGDVSEPAWRTVRKGTDWGGEKLPAADVLLRMLRRSEQAGEEARRQASLLEQRRVRVAELLQEDDLALSWRLRGKIAGLAREVERRERAVEAREDRIEAVEARSKETVQSVAEVEERLAVASEVLHLAARCFGKYRPEEAQERLAAVAEALGPNRPRRLA